MPCKEFFPSVSSFHDWFSKLPQYKLPDNQKYEDPYREVLPDDSLITFTHADLHMKNILVTTDSMPRLMAIIDWGQAGWYPEYWEYCKASFTSAHGSEWREKWIPVFLRSYPREHEIFALYCNQMGAV